jgi:hypothetical protein
MDGKDLKLFVAQASGFVRPKVDSPWGRMHQAQNIRHSEL